MIVLLHRKTLEPPLPDVPVGAIDLVMAPDICRHQPLHPFTQLFGLFRPHDHVKVIRHETVRENLDRIEPSAQSQEVSERLEIFAFVEDVPLSVATVEDMVDETISEGSGYSWHAYSRSHSAWSIVHSATSTFLKHFHDAKASSQAWDSTHGKRRLI